MAVKSGLAPIVNENRSQLDPHVGLVSFDTSKSGAIEMYYDGAMKDKELIVTNPMAIPYSVEILAHDDSVIGDAREIINDGFKDWLPAIRQLGILSASDRETEALRSILDDDDSSSPPSGTSASPSALS